MKKLILSLAAAAALSAPAHSQVIGSGNTFNDATDEVRILRNGTANGSASAASFAAYINGLISAADVSVASGVIAGNDIVLTMSDGTSVTILGAATDTDTFATIAGNVITFADGSTFDLATLDDSAAIAANATAQAATDAAQDAALAAAIAADADKVPTNELGAVTVTAGGTIAYDADGNADLSPVDLATQAELDAVSASIPTGGDVAVDSFNSAGATIVNSGTPDALNLDVASTIATDAEVAAAVSASAALDLDTDPTNEIELPADAAGVLTNDGVGGIIWATPAASGVASVNGDTGPSVVLDGSEVNSTTAQGVLTSGDTVDEQLEALESAIATNTADPDTTADSFVSTGGTIVNAGTADGLDLDVAASIATDAEVSAAVAASAALDLDTDPTNEIELPADAAGILTNDGVGGITWSAAPTFSDATTADNGLTETGDNVQFGGALTKNTAIDGPFTLDIFLDGETTDIMNIDSATDFSRVAVQGSQVLLSSSDGTNEAEIEAERSGNIRFQSSTGQYSFEDTTTGLMNVPIGDGNEVIAALDPTGEMRHVTLGSTLDLSASGVLEAAPLAPSVVVAGDTTYTQQIANDADGLMLIWNGASYQYPIGITMQSQKSSTTSDVTVDSATPATRDAIVITPKGTSYLYLSAQVQFENLDTGAGTNQAKITVSIVDGLGGVVASSEYEIDGPAGDFVVSRDAVTLINRINSPASTETYSILIENDSASGNDYEVINSRLIIREESR